MSSPARWTARREPPTCWRRAGSRLCGRPTFGPAELCDAHAAEMRTWSGCTPRPAPGPAVGVWLDLLDRQLDQAIRSAA